MLAVLLATVAGASGERFPVAGPARRAGLRAGRTGASAGTAHLIGDGVGTGGGPRTEPSARPGTEPGGMTFSTAPAGTREPGSRRCTACGYRSASPGGAIAEPGAGGQRVGDHAQAGCRGVPALGKL